MPYKLFMCSIFRCYRIILIIAYEYRNNYFVQMSAVSFAFIFIDAFCAEEIYNTYKFSRDFAKVLNSTTLFSQRFWSDSYT